jgi:long-chain acyl-CoA synthetase
MPTASPSPANNVAALLAQSACAWPTLPALALGSSVVCDYATLALRASQLASAFVASGLRPGDRVALVSRNVPAYVEALFACWWAGLVAVPVNAKLHPRELAFVLQDCGARWALTDAAWRSAIEASADGKDALQHVLELGSANYERLVASGRTMDLAACADDDPAWIFYTSGTTGRPKGVVITHRNLHAMGKAFVASVESIAPGDALLAPAPLSHGSGLYLVPPRRRRCVSVLPESSGFDADEIFALFSGMGPLGILRGADDGETPRCAHQASPTRGSTASSSSVYGGGPMYVADAKAAFAVLGPRTRADLRPGRIADDDHRDDPRRDCGRDRSRRRCPARIGRHLRSSGSTSE